MAGVIDILIIKLQMLSECFWRTCGKTQGRCVWRCDCYTSSKRDPGARSNCNL
jgi:hypothetical protein